MNERIKILLLVVSVLFFLSNTHASDFKKMEDGVVVFPDASLSGGVNAVRLQIINENIIRVHAYAQIKEPENKSLIIIPGINRKVQWTLHAANGSITVSTSQLKALVDLHTGQIS